MMLTRRQQWRKQKKFISRSNQDFLYDQGVSDDSTSLSRPNRSASEPSVSLLLISNFGRLWSTTGDLESKNTPPRKSVRFGHSVHVTLIPTREEYTKAGLAPVMWWDSNDYAMFKDSAVTEIRNLMMIDDRIDCKTAQIILYQPSSESQAEIKSKLIDLHSNHDSIRHHHHHLGSSYSNNNEEEELKEDSPESQDITTMTTKAKAIESSKLERSINPISLTHIRSEIDLLHLYDEMASLNSDHLSDKEKNECVSGLLSTSSSPDKKQNIRNQQYQNQHHSKHQTIFTVDATKIAHAQSAIRQHAIHPLAFICS